MSPVHDPPGLTVTVSEGVALLTIDRQERRNALDDVTMRALADTFTVLARDDAVRAVVLTGAGDKAFSAGVDLAAFAARPPAGPDDDWYALGPLLASVYAKPIVAAVNGVAVAAGLELVLACDVIVAAEHASSGIPEVKRGLIAAGGGTVLPGPEVLPEAIRLARAIAANAPLALRLTKELMYASLDLDRAASRARAQEAGYTVNASNDAREGATAFVQKRSPRWTGD
jgi:enoyl-CoA hydratase